MPDLVLEPQQRDEHTAAQSATLSLGSAKLATPGRVVTTSELRSAKSVKHPDLEPKFLVVGRLVSQDTLQLVLKEEEAFQKFATSTGAGGRMVPGAARLFFQAYRGGVEMNEAEDARPFLDLQHLLGFEVLTVQFGSGPSPEDFLATLDYVKRWRKEKDNDKPLMPILTPQDLALDAGKLLKAVVKRGADAIGLDLQGTFPYHTLRAVEELKRGNPGLWVHAFQAQPKVRFAGRRLATSLGMVLPTFGVDSFSRWVVPPPPVPVKKEKVNFFDRKGWGIVKWAEHRELYGERLACGCPICKRADLEAWFADDDRVVLNKAHVHDHYAQTEELAKAAEKLKDTSYNDALKSKRFGKAYLEALAEAAGED